MFSTVLAALFNVNGIFIHPSIYILNVITILKLNINISEVDQYTVKHVIKDL